MGAAVGRQARLEEWLAPFRILFTRPTWQRVLVLATGAILTTHRRTVAAALRVTGRGEDAGFSRYHGRSQPEPMVYAGGCQAAPCPVGRGVSSPPARW